MSYQVECMSHGTIGRSVFCVFDWENGKRMVYPLFYEKEPADNLCRHLWAGAVSPGDYQWEPIPKDVSSSLVRDSHLRRKPNVGEKWRLRNGMETIEPLRSNNNKSFVLCARCSDGKYRTWKEDGSVNYDGESDFDLFESIEVSGVGSQSLKVEACPDPVGVVVDSLLVSLAMDGQLTQGVVVTVDRVSAKHESGTSVVWDRGMLSITVGQWGASIEAVGLSDIQCLSACFQGILNQIATEEKRQKD